MKKSKIEGLDIKNKGIDVLIQNTEPMSTSRNKQEQEKITRINFEITEDLKDRLKIYCVKNKISIRDFITEIILERLGNQQE